MKVLYVGHDLEHPSDYCPGSVLCLSCVSKLRHITIRVQDTRILKQHAPLPDWLNGTPILIDENEGNPICGIHAYRFLQELVHKEDAELINLEQKRPRAPAEQPSNHRMQPINTRQPSAKRRDVREEETPQALQESVMPDFEDDDEAQDATSHGISHSASMSNDKVTDGDLQRFMAQRNASPASASTNLVQES